MVFLLFYEPVTTEKNREKNNAADGVGNILVGDGGGGGGDYPPAGMRGKCTVAPKREIYDITAFAEEVRGSSSRERIERKEGRKKEWEKKET